VLVAAKALSPSGRAGGCIGLFSAFSLWNPRPGVMPTPSAALPPTHTLLNHCHLSAGQGTRLLAFSSCQRTGFQKPGWGVGCLVIPSASGFLCCGCSEQRPRGGWRGNPALLG
jgi:hypothetical protein